jgi:hypothetical protein
MKRPFDLSAAAWLKQAIFYAIVVAAIGYFASGPAYHPIKPDQAELKLVVRYSGKLLGECHRLDSAELEELAPNMRAPMVCPREKSPLLVEVSVDGDVIFERQVEPAGLQNDGVLALYKTFVFNAGPADLRVRIKEDMREQQFTQTLERAVEFDPDRILVVEFNDDGFRLSQPSAPGEETG